MGGDGKPQRGVGINPPSRDRGRDGTAAQPTPSQESEQPQPDGEDRGPTLDVSGFASASDDQPTEPSPQSPPAREPSGEGNSQKRKANVQLPHRLADALREAAEEHDRALLDVVTDAFVAHHEDVRQQLVDPEAAEQRAELGLPPPTPPPPRSVSAGEPRGQVGLYGSTQTVAVLDETADELGISRSHFVEELLERHLPVGQDSRD